MNNFFRITIFFVLILIPLIFYKKLSHHRKDINVTLPIAINKGRSVYKPKVAIIFDDFGENLKDIKTLYSLNIPVTISVIPGLKFSKNIAVIGARCGFSIFIHLPFQPKEETKFNTAKYQFISSSLTKNEIDAMLRYYLNYIRVAIGVNNHMGSAATQDKALMHYVLEIIKRRGLIFIDSRTSSDSLAYVIAKEKGMLCGYSEGFLDSVHEPGAIRNKLYRLIDKAKEKGKIIIIAHPQANTFKVLKDTLPQLKKEVEFVNIRDYFDL